MRKHYDPEELFFTSDQHFGHSNVISFCDRPFANVDEMDEELIARHNAVIPPAATVFMLGDLSFHPNQRTMEIVTELNGFKYLILGNHDAGLSRYVLDLFEGVANYHELSVRSRKVVLCHFPFRSWNNMAHGALNLHGHCHGKLEEQRNQFDVGVDVWSYTPVPYDHILEVSHVTNERPD